MAEKISIIRQPGMRHKNLTGITAAASQFCFGTNSDGALSHMAYGTKPRDNRGVSYRKLLLNAFVTAILFHRNFSKYMQEIIIEPAYRRNLHFFIRRMGARNSRSKRNHI